MYQFQSERIETPEGNVHVRVAGPEDGLAVLLVHGLSGFSRDWDLMADHLTEGLRLIAVDLPGFGDSFETADHHYPIEMISEVMRQSLAQFSSGDPLVVAHSKGARQVLALPPYLEQGAISFVLIDGAPAVPLEARMQVARRIAGAPDDYGSLEEAAESLSGNYPAYSAEQFSERLKHYLRKTEHGRFTIKRDPIFKKEFQNVLKGLPNPGGEEPNWWELYQEVNVPVHLVRATKSLMINEEIMQRMNSLKPDLKIWEIESRHNVPGEKPRELADIINKVVDNVRKGCDALE